LKSGAFATTKSTTVLKIARTSFFNNEDPTGGKRGRKIRTLHKKGEGLRHPKIHNPQILLAREGLATRQVYSELGAGNVI
jgi:hypothetical protein